MLRKRSRPVSSSKQAIICEHNNSSSIINFPAPNSEKLHKPTSSFFNSPRIFKDFFSSNSISSPSSALGTKAFGVQKKIQHPKTFSSIKHTKHSWEQPAAIGLALIDDPQLGPVNTSKSCKQRSKLVVLGSHLKIQIPTPPKTLKTMEFGIKTPKTNHIGHVSANSVQQEEDYYKEKKRLLIKDMELSEDYTCVISHGPNPKTTHIYGNCIVKSSSSASSTRQGNKVSPAPGNLSFLSFCHHCNNKIEQGKDIYMYRGEKAFCTEECRSQEMLFDGIEC